jgi:hypothetical protein
MTVVDARPDPLGIVPPPAGSQPAGSRHQILRRNAWSLSFLVPAAIWLLAIVVYPVFATIRYSFFDESGKNFVGGSNYGSPDVSVGAMTW